MNIISNRHNPQFDCNNRRDCYVIIIRIIHLLKKVKYNFTFKKFFQGWGSIITNFAGSCIEEV
jgi:hypothetical protein